MTKKIFNDIANAKNNAILYPRTNQDDNFILNSLGISENSTLGFVIKYTAGISIDNGWLRLFGGESSEYIECITNWNHIGNFKNAIADDALVIAYDLIGGFFAINASAFGSNLGVIYYYAPDNLVWESLDLGHTDFFYWCLNGNIRKFYEPYYWKSYLENLSSVKAGYGFSLYPPLFAKEGQDINSVSKKIISLREIWNINQKYQNSLNNANQW